MFNVRMLLAVIFLISGLNGFAQTVSTFSAGQISIVGPSSLTVTQPQQLVKSPFAVRITNNAGHPVSGLTIRYINDYVSCPPGSICELPGTFSFSNRVLTDENGVARSPDFVAGVESGEYRVLAAFDPLLSPADGAFLGPAFTQVEAYFTVSQQVDFPSFVISPALSGSWFDPKTPGQGLNLEFIPGNGEINLLVYWYTFDPQGNNVFLVGSNDFNPGSSADVLMYTTTGGFFPPAFDAGKIQRNEWGTIRLSFSDCNNALFTWLPSTPLANGYTSGSTSITRLTSLAGLNCSP